MNKIYRISFVDGCARYFEIDGRTLDLIRSSETVSYDIVYLPDWGVGGRTMWDERKIKTLVFIDKIVMIEETE